MFFLTKYAFADKWVTVDRSWSIVKIFAKVSNRFGDWNSGGGGGGVHVVVGWVGVARSTATTL